MLFREQYSIFIIPEVFHIIRDIKKIIWFCSVLNSNVLQTLYKKTQIEAQNY
jgi:hypothetical protein